MSGHTLLTPTISGKMEDSRQRARRGKEKQRSKCVANGIRMLKIRGGWRIAASEPRTWYDGKVNDGGNEVHDRMKK